MVMGRTRNSLVFPLVDWQLVLTFLSISCTRFGSLLSFLYHHLSFRHLAGLLDVYLRLSCIVCQNQLNLYAFSIDFELCLFPLYLTFM